jgi:hypothetical protein
VFRFGLSEADGIGILNLINTKNEYTHISQFKEINNKFFIGFDTPLKSQHT